MFPTGGRQSGNSLAKELRQAPRAGSAGGTGPPQNHSSHRCSPHLCCGAQLPPCMACGCTESHGAYKSMLFTITRSDPSLACPPPQTSSISSHLRPTLASTWKEGFRYARGPPWLSQAVRKGWRSWGCSAWRVVAERCLELHLQIPEELPHKGQCGAVFCCPRRPDRNQRVKLNQKSFSALH